jgi:hypothetical protein
MVDNTEHPGPRAYTKAHVVHLIETALKATRISSASQLARLAGVATSTITRAANPDTDYMPSTRTVGKIANAVSELLLQNETELEKNIAEHTRASASIANTKGVVPIVGEAEVGSLKKSKAIFERNPSFVAVTDPDFRGKTLIAFRIIGDETDRDYKDGTVVICASYPEETIFAGDIVVRRRRLDTFLGAVYETTLWDVLEGENGKAKFQPRWVKFPEQISTNADLVGVRPNVVDTTILGVVVGAYTKHSRNAARPVSVD